MSKFLNFNRQIPQPTVRKQNSDGYYILPILLGMLKQVLDNEVIASSPNVSTKLRTLINELENDKNLARRILELQKVAVSNGDVKRFNKEVERIIRALAKRPAHDILTMLVAADTHVPLPTEWYEAISGQAHCVYLFCPTKKQEEIYRSQINEFDEYVFLKRIVLIHSKDLEFFRSMWCVGYIYSPKIIEINSETNKFKELTSLEEVQKVLDLDKAVMKVV